MKSSFFLLAILLCTSACNEVLSSTTTIRGDAGGGGPTGCQGEIELDFGVAASGDTGAGWETDLSAWLASSQVACTPSDMVEQYPAPYDAWAFEMPARSDWDVVVTPTGTADLSFVAYTQRDTACSAALGRSVDACQAANLGSAGAAEVIHLSATDNAVRVIVLVTTPQGGESGAYTIATRNHE